jgi:hypothetical protein
MSEVENRSGGDSRRYRAGFVMIVVTTAACVAAVVLRTPIRSLMWARQVVEAESASEQAAALTQLCNAGDAGRWGTERLLRSDDPAIRQTGVIVLQHIRSEWSRRRLIEMLGDPSRAAADFAALGLAIHGEISVIPRLKRLYLEGDDGTASAACLALERIGAPESRAALVELAAEPVGADRRAELADALGSVGGGEGARGLLCLLDDHRVANAPPRAERLLEQLSGIAAAKGLAPASTPGGAAGTTSDSRESTVAERAAAALSRITGLSPPFSSSASQQTHAEAVAAWTAWIESADQHQ